MYKTVKETKKSPEYAGCQFVLCDHLKSGEMTGVSRTVYIGAKRRVLLCGVCSNALTGGHIKTIIGRLDYIRQIYALGINLDYDNQDEENIVIDMITSLIEYRNAQQKKKPWPRNKDNHVEQG